MEKKLILCDTNIFIHWFNRDEKTIEQLEKIGLSNILIPSVTIMELIQGTQTKQELQQLKKKLKNYNIIHINDKVSQLSLKLQEEYRLSHSLSIPDALIGATAITFDLCLFTYNTKDFKYLPKIQLYKY
jgi:predicted nucleic acid-binding protein